MVKDEVSLRERTRRAVRSEIAEAAMELFVAQGFEETTVEQIAQSSGMSRRSYFRYFSSKDEALTEGLIAVGVTIAEALSTRPDTEGAWLALRRSFDLIAEQTDRDPRAKALGRLMLERPGLQHDKNATWSSTIASALAPRLASPGASPGIASDALAVSAIACLHVAQRRWLQPDEQAPLGVLLDAAMAAVRPLD